MFIKPSAVELVGSGFFVDVGYFDNYNFPVSDAALSAAVLMFMYAMSESDWRFCSTFLAVFFLGP